LPEADLDVAARLMADTTGEYHRALLARLRKLADACAARLRVLHDPWAFRRLEATGAAIAAAIAVVEAHQALWPRERPEPAPLSPAQGAPGFLSKLRRSHASTSTP
jgi:hypothetical protein